MKITVFQNENQIAEKELDPSKEYIIGRSTQNDIVVRHPEISRRHARLFFANGQWTCELLSAQGIMTSASQQVSSVNIANGSQFEILEFKFRFNEAEVQKNTATVELKSDTARITPEDGEKTNPGNAPHRFALLRLDEMGEPFEEIVLGEGVVEAGRSDECEIMLRDTKASRKHFSIEGANAAFVINDLGSTHGTFVNNEKIGTHRLNAGDILLVGREKFLFQEIHPSFEQILPHEQQPDLAANVPAAVALSEGRDKVIKYGTRKNKKLLPVYVALGILLVFGFYNSFFSQKPQPDRAPSNNGQVDGTGTLGSSVDKLTPEQKKFLEDTYNLALNLYTSGKYDLAALEIAKIFQVVQQYKDARNIELLCQQALEIKKQKEEADRLQAEQNELKQKVNNILADCERLFNSGKYAQVEGCVSAVTDMDPDNGRARELVDNAQVKLDEVQSNAEARRERQRRLVYAQQSFEKARKALQEKRYPAAIEQFAAVTKSSFEDKNGLKQKAAEGIKFAKDKMKESSQTLINEGKSALDNKDYKTAIIKFNKALQIFAESPDAKMLRERAASELRTEMKNLYSESVIEENLGNIESAKKKWRTILDQDIPTDSYYEKARSKTSKYDR